MFVKFMCTIITILLFSVSTFYANKKIRKKGIRFVVSVMLFFISLWLFLMAARYL